MTTFISTVNEHENGLQGPSTTSNLQYKNRFYRILNSY